MRDKKGDIWIEDRMNNERKKIINIYRRVKDKERVDTYVYK